MFDSAPQLSSCSKGDTSKTSLLNCSNFHRPPEQSQRSFVDLVDLEIRRISLGRSDQAQFILSNYSSGQDEQYQVVAWPYPHELKQKLKAVRGNLVIGILARPVNRLFAIVDSKLYLWALPAIRADCGDVVDQISLDLEDPPIFVDVVASDQTIDVRYLLVGSKSALLLYRLIFEQHGEMRVATDDDADDDDVGLNFMSYRTNDGDEISSIFCAEGRVFFGTQKSQLFEIVIPSKSVGDGGPHFPWLFGGLAHSNPALRARKLCSLIQRNLFAYFIPGLDRELKSVRKIVASDSAVYALLSGSEHASHLYGYFFDQNILRHIDINNPISSFAILARFVPYEDPVILVVTEDGTRIVIDCPLSQVLGMDRAVVPSGKVRAAFIDPLTGIVLCQQQSSPDDDEDGDSVSRSADSAPHLFIGRIQNYQQIMPAATPSTFIYACQNSFDASSRIPLSYSHLVQPDIELQLASSSAIFSIHRPSPAAAQTKHSKIQFRHRNEALSLLASAIENKEFSPSDLASALAQLIADLVYPYWNRPLARLTPGDAEKPTTQIACDDIVTLSNLLDRLTALFCVKHSRHRQLVEFLVELRDILYAWQLVSAEHQLHLVLDRIPAEKRTELRNRLLTTTLNEMLGEQNGLLINEVLRGLINLYVDDNAATDSLMQRLSRLSARIFSPGSSYIGYATERINRLTKLDIPAESRRRLLVEVYNYLERAGLDVDLEVWAPILARFPAFHADLARLTLGLLNRHLDPRNRALHVYTESDGMDHDDEQLFTTRMDTYRLVLDSCEVRSMLESDLIQTFLRSQDLLAHVAVYQYIIEVSGTDKAQKIFLQLGPSPNLVKFLKQLLDTEDLVSFAALTLVRLYQQANEWAESCQSLCFLAMLPSVRDPNLSIKDRIDYLSQAIVIAKSSRINTNERNRLLPQLTRWLNSARLQASLADYVSDSELKRLLRFGDLVDMTDLYKNYAEPYHCLEHQLAILSELSFQHCNMVDEPQRKQVRLSLWKRLCQNEVANCSAPERGICLAFTLISTTQISDHKLVPLNQIVAELEQCSAKCDLAPEWAFNRLSGSANVDLNLLLPAYEFFVSTGAAQGDHAEFRFDQDRVVNVALACLNKFCKHATSSRTPATTTALRIAKYVQNHYRTHNKTLIDQLKTIEIELERRFVLGS